MNYLMTISYDGSKFWGFQRLNEENSVQKCLENALSKINKKEVVVKGAGRTDRGVHANGQCVSFKLDIKIENDGLKKALNSILKPYIYVKKIEVVDDDFHARFNVLRKKYIYKINLGEYNPLLSDYVYQTEYKLDIKEMREVADLYLGVHNFHNFVSGERNDSTAIIYDIEFIREGDILNISFIGKSFYRYMVRNLVGMMIEVGRGKEEIVKVVEMLDSTDEINGYTAPACGLYLDKIEY
ncbi:MAG TPA: tRNA pseudouridine(38-40) synthase TruA [Candidatus Coprovivens excrementavium]|nr:tRNA pseudouridine(38-40) synthase TruA [Candidatus Coprovivens excrementavium]